MDPTVHALQETARQHRRNQLRYTHLHDVTRAAQQEMKALEYDLHQGRDLLIEYVKQLDCHSAGNYGYENRMATLLGELCLPTQPAPTGVVEIV